MERTTSAPEALGGPSFELDEGQRAVEELARDFARREIAPQVAELDEKQQFPGQLFRQAGELGFLGVLVPEELGGAGLGYVDYALIIRELARVDPAVALSVAAHNSLGTNHILKFGNPEQRERWVPALARGEKLAGWGLTEADAGSDAAATRTRAERTEGGYLLNGAKVFTTHGSVGDVLVIMAVTDPDAPRHRNVSAFVVERGSEGLEAGKKENKLGVRASDTAEVVLDDCFVPDDHLLGAAGRGFQQALEILDGGRISIAALGVGTALGAYDAALAYAKERHQFGRPIAEFQAIRFMLAEMSTKIAAAEILTLTAAAQCDAGEDFARLASEAKLFAGETAVFCAERGVQIHGGYGLVKDYPAEKFFRDAKICTIGEGTSEIQRLVIARQLLRDE